LAGLTSFAAKGTYGGWDTDFQKVPVEIFAKAPGQRTTIAHTRLGDATTTYDGRAGGLRVRTNRCRCWRCRQARIWTGSSWTRTCRFQGGSSRRWPLARWLSRDCDRRSRGGSGAGNHGGAGSRVKLFFRQKDGTPGPAGALYDDGGGDRADADRLLGLSRRGGDQDAVSLDGDVDQRAIDHGVERGADECAGGRGEVWERPAAPPRP